MFQTRTYTACRWTKTAALLTAVALLGAACARRAKEPELVGEPPSESPATSAGSAGLQSMPSEGPRLLIRAQFPTALAISPERKLFFAERTGRIWMLDLSRRPEDGDPAVKLVFEIPVSTAGERGLLGLAIHPDFTNNPFVYAFASPASNIEISQIHRLRLDEDQVVEGDVIVELPAGRGCCHKGGRLAFGPDGKLYIAVGDNQIPRAAADATDLRGKILRYEPDGTVPLDGPFGPSNPVWARGLRNPFGLTFAESGDAYATDNGPSGNDGPACCDEVDRLRAGGDYGWPESFGPDQKSGIPPIWNSGKEVVVPTGLVVVSSPRFAALEGAIAFCSFAERRMFVVDGEGKDWSHGLAGPGRGPDGCALDVVQDPDGRLFFADTDAVYVWG